ncbi:hypothetical protein CALVIDRAFT_211256 [Calocera viscosa TUFC12733]|uniref:Uncharacterized protein n=1 Tax=Calocera viscosa (strain TUFC12733) TaxID=1330018 RepID=A0A167RBL5_CALVF|nr:hypothetical protein CALVIDRAFT_211256 [Calocera viscosa TUFC12733]
MYAQSPHLTILRELIPRPPNLIHLHQRRPTPTPTRTMSRPPTPPSYPLSLLLPLHAPLLTHTTLLLLHTALIPLLLALLLLHLAFSPFLWLLALLGLLLPDEEGVEAAWVARWGERRVNLSIHRPRLEARREGKEEARRRSFYGAFPYAVTAVTAENSPSPSPRRAPDYNCGEKPSKMEMPTTDEELRKSPVTGTCTGYGKWKHRPTWEKEVSERLRLEEREACEMGRATSRGEREIVWREID